MKTILASPELLTNNENKDRRKNIRNFFGEIYFHQIFMKYKYTEISFYLNCKLMDWVLYNDNSVLKGFHGTSEWLLACHNIYVEILHMFQQDVPFLTQHRRQSSPLFSPCFCGDFFMFEMWCFSYLLGIFLTHFRSVLSLCKNQPIDLNYLLMTWFLNNDNAGLKWVKENLTGCLDITPAWKPYLVSGKCFFSSAT